MEFNGGLIKSMDWVLELSRLGWRNSTDGGIQRVEIFCSAACQRFEVELFHDSGEFSVGGGVFEVLFRQWFEVYVFHDSGGFSTAGGFLWCCFYSGSRWKCSTTWVELFNG